MSFLIRQAAFLMKELNEVRRQPRLMGMLILGPIGILLLFGAGYRGHRIPPDAVVVVPAPAEDDPRVQELIDRLEGTVNVVAVMADREEAVQMLRSGEVDVVEIAPESLEADDLESGTLEFEVVYDAVDPIAADWIEFASYLQSYEVNRALLLGRAAGLSESADAASSLLEEASTALDSITPTSADARAAVARLEDDLESLRALVDVSSEDPERLIAPVTHSTTNLYGEPPTMMRFYAPAVMALILQHIAVTLAALSLVREETTGAIELLRVAPIQMGQVLLGKAVAQFILSMILAAALFGALLLIGVPVLVLPVPLFVLLTLFVLSSLAVGFMISAVSDSDSQAIQLTMLFLLVSIFFSGFFLPLENFRIPISWLGTLLPLTQTIEGLQSILFRSSAPGILEWARLVFVTLVAAVIAQRGWTRLERQS